MQRWQITLLIVVGLLLVGLLSGEIRAQNRGLYKADHEDVLAGSYHKVWGVIIGIDRYPRLSKENQLNYAVSDAQAVEELLEQGFRFEEMISLYNEEATRDGIMSVLRGRLGKTDKDDGVFVFFAGHGRTRKTEDFGELGYLIPHDGSADPTDAKNISMELLKSDISRGIPAKHVFFVMDACYGGLLLQTRALDEHPRVTADLTYLQEITREPVRQVLTAGGADQEVLDEGRGGHSVFTGRLLQKLEETQGYLTANELGAWLPKLVFQDALSRGQDPPQRPQFGRLFGEGDFVFIKRPSLVQSLQIEEEEPAIDRRERMIRELELLRQLRPHRGESIRDRAGELVAEEDLSEMRRGVLSFKTISADALDHGRVTKISDLFHVPADRIERFRWGPSMSPPDHPLAGATWNTIWYRDTISDTVATETIRIDPSSRIIDRIRW